MDDAVERAAESVITPGDGDLRVPFGVWLIEPAERHEVRGAAGLEEDALQMCTP